MQPYVRKKFKSYKLDTDFDGAPICEWCESRRSVDVDHIWGRLWKLKNDVRNLIFLCRECHMKKGGFDQKTAFELLVREKLERIRDKKIEPLFV